jgi:hypothetical protein
MSKQDIEKRLGFAAQGVKAEMATPMRGGEFDQAKSFLNQVSSGFNIESLKESLVGAKEVARFAPQYKALGQKLPPRGKGEVWSLQYGIWIPC